MYELDEFELDEAEKEIVNILTEEEIQELWIKEQNNLASTLWLSETK